MKRVPPRELRTVGWLPALVAVLVLVGSLLVVFPNDDPPFLSSLADLPDVAPQLSAEPEPVVGLRYPASPPGWHQRDSGPLASRMGVAAVWSGAQLLIWGGGSMRADYTSGAMYRPDAIAAPAWSNMTRPPIAGGSVGAAAWTDRGLLVYTNAPALFDPSSNVWTPLDPVREPFRPLAATVTDTGVLLIGTTTDEDGSFSATIAVEYGRDIECCTALPALPVELTHAAALWAEDRVVVIGAGPSDSTPNLLTYDPSRREWTTHAAPALDAARGLAAVWADDALVVVDANLDTAIWRLGTGWAPGPPAPFEERSCWPRLAALGDTVFAWYCRGASTFSPATLTWTPVAAPELPSHTISTSCVPVATERSVLVWCGNGDGADPILWEYEPG